MNHGFTKLFSSILASTIWQENNPTRIVWITMLAMADRDGEVAASIPGLARYANVSLEECEAALASFLAPDKYSRTTDFEGRRIEVIAGGWRLLNHAKYREAMRGVDRAEYLRLKQAEGRAKKKGVSTKPSTNVNMSTIVNQCQPIAEAEAVEHAISQEAPKSLPINRHHQKPPQSEIDDFTAKNGLSRRIAKKFFDTDADYQSFPANTDGTPPPPRDWQTALLAFATASNAA